MRRATPFSPVTGLGWSVVLTLLVVAAGCGVRDPGDEAPIATSVVVTTTRPASTATAASDTDPTATSSSDDDAAETGGRGDGTGDDTGQGEGIASGSVDDPIGWTGVTHRLVEVATLDTPIAMAIRPGSDDLWIAERDGRVRLVQRLNADGPDRPTYTTVNDEVIDIADRVSTGGEGGLLGLDFSADGTLLYLSFTNNNGESTLAEYEMAGNRADPGSERILLQVEQPWQNHNGGQVTRGPDDLLYLALGDGGSGGDPLDSGQDTSTLLGAILRIDPFNPGGEAPYGIPADNPFADGQGGLPEIWLYGVRNPWRFSFDRANRDLWVADVGQNAIEEITHLPAGGGLAGRDANLGWRLMEGDRTFESDGPPAGHVGPIYTYDHDGGRCSITGGYVYRGRRLPALTGVYLFGDYCSGELFGLQTVDEGLLVANLAADQGAGNVISFGEDADGEVYVLSANGSVLLIDTPA